MSEKDAAEGGSATADSRRSVWQKRRPVLMM
jgi:hypothetical protein